MVALNPRLALVRVRPCLTRKQQNLEVGGMGGREGGGRLCPDQFLILLSVQKQAESKIHILKRGHKRKVSPTPRFHLGTFYMQ